MITLDLNGAKLEESSISQIVQQTQLENVNISADIKGFKLVRKIYKDDLGSTQYSAGSIFARGAFLEIGGELALQTSKNEPPGIRFYDGDGLDQGSLIAEIINYQ